MAPRTLPNEILIETVEAKKQHPTHHDAATALGISRGAFENRLRLAAGRGLLGPAETLPGYSIKSVSTQRGPDGETQREWVQQTKEVGEPFAVPEGHSVKGVSALVDSDGRTVQQWVKTTADDTTATLLDHIKTAFANYEGPILLPPAPISTNADLMSVYVLTDVHHGMLSWGAETGEDYDISLGSARLRSCMADLITQAPPSGEALVLNLGDYFHSNDNTNATPASKHVLDMDSRFFKVVTTGIRLFMDCIDMALQKHERVRVRCLPGNHDPESSIALTVALAAFYHANPRVIVEQNPSEFFFRLFGNTLIGACHGHRMKPDRMAMSMAMMRPQEWGASKFRWFLFGHIHHETVREVGNVRCESFQTLAAKDAYAANSGYQAGQSLTSITLHRDRGEIGRHRVNIA